MTAPAASERTSAASSYVVAIIVAGAAVRLLLGASVGLGVDESYAVAIARTFSWSYFDHPPLHFWIAGAAASLAGTESAVVVRLPFILCFAGTTWFLWRIGARLFDERAGLLGALLLNVSAVFSLSTGGWVLPDGPLMLCATAAVDRITRILWAEAPQQATRDWLLAGLLTGLAMLSKYHGVFVLAGTAVFLATSARHRHWLRAPGPWLGTFVALAMFAPVVWWNAAHGWASFAFQGGRAAPAAGIHLGTFLANIGGQLAWVLPWVFVPLAASAWRALRAGPRDDARWLLLCLAAGPIVVFTLVSLRGDVGLPHWQAPGWLFVFPMLGAAVAARMATGDRRATRWLRATAWGYVGLITFLGTHASTGWLARLAPSAFERGDPTADLVTWSRLRVALMDAEFDPDTDFIAATSWIQAGKAAVGAGPGVRVVCLCADPHHFEYVNPQSAFLGRDAIIVHKVRAGDDVPSRFAKQFESIEPAGEFAVTRRRQEVMAVELFRARGFRAPYGAVEAP